MGEKLKQILDFLSSPALVVAWGEADEIKALMKKKKLEDKREIVDITPKQVKNAKNRQNQD